MMSQSSGFGVSGLCVNGHSVDTPSVDINTRLSGSSVGQNIICPQYMKQEGQLFQHSNTLTLILQILFLFVCVVVVV